MTLVSPRRALGLKLLHGRQWLRAWLGAAVLSVLLLGGARETRGTAAAETTQGEVLLQLRDDPGKALALIAESARRRGSATQDEYLLALEALTKPVSWQVSAPLDRERSHGPVESVTFTPPLPKGADPKKDGARFWPQRKWLVWAWQDGTVALLDLNSSSGPVVISNPTSRFQSGKLLFSPDGRWLVKASSQANCQIWDVSAGLPGNYPKALIASKQQSQFIGTMFTADSQFLVVAEKLDLVARKAPDWEEHYRIPDIWQWTTLPEFGNDLVGSSWHRVAPSSPGQLSRTPLLRCTLDDKRCSELPSQFATYRTLLADPQTGLLALYGGDGDQEVEIRQSPYVTAKDTTRIEASANLRILNEKELLVSSGTVLYRQHTHTRACNRRNPFVGHAEQVLTMQVVTRGKRTWILSVGAEGVAQLHTAHQSKNERLIGRFQFAEDKIAKAVLSPDAEMVAAGLADEGSVRLWFTQAPSGQSLEAPMAALKRVYAQDSRSFIVASGAPSDSEFGEYPYVFVWPKSGSEPGHSAPLENLKECLDPKVCLAGKDLIAAGGACDGIRFWRIGSDKFEREISGTGKVTDLVCLPGGEVVSAGPQGVRHFSAGGIERRLFTEEKANRLAQLSVSPRGDLVMAAWPSGAIQLWKPSDWKPSQISFPTPFRSAQLVDNQTALVVDDKGEVWDLRLPGGLPTRHPGLSPAGLVSVSRDGKLVAVGYRSGVRIGWRNSGRQYSLWHGTAVGPIEFSEDGRSLLIVDGNTVLNYLLPPTDLKQLASWLASRTPFVIEGGAMRPRRFPGLAALASQPR